MARELPNLRNVGAPLPRSEQAKDVKAAALGSAALKSSIAKAIVHHAQINRICIPQAMNQLLYGGELR